MAEPSAVLEHNRFFDNLGHRMKRGQLIEGSYLRAARILHRPLLDRDICPPSRDHTVVFSLRQECTVHRYYDGHLSGASSHIRTTSILPAGRTTGWGATLETEVLHVYLDDHVLRRHINDTHDIDPSSIDVLDTMGKTDEEISRLAPLILRQISDSTPVTKLMLDGFEQIVAAHLISRYASTPREPEAVGALDPKTLARVIQYMRDNLELDLSLEDLAEHTSMSLYSFARAFKAATGTSPHQMLLAERVARVAQLLRNDNMPLAEVAYAVGFSSQSHMTTTFAKHMGVTPGRYRQDCR